MRPEGLACRSLLLPSLSTAAVSAMIRSVRCPASDQEDAEQGQLTTREGDLLWEHVRSDAKYASFYPHLGWLV